MLGGSPIVVTLQYLDRIRIGANDRNGFTGFGVQRQDPIIFQQHHTFLCCSQGHRMVGGRIIFLIGYGIKWAILVKHSQPHPGHHQVRDRGIHILLGDKAHC